MPKPVYQQDKGVFKLKLYKDVGNDVGNDVGKELNSLQTLIIGLIRNNPSVTAIEISTKLSVTKRTVWSERNCTELHRGIHKVTQRNQNSA